MRTVYKTNTIFKTITASGQIPDTKGCNAITVRNTGEVDLTINGSFVLGPGEDFANSQPHPDMYDATDYDLFFEEGGGASVAITFANAIDPETKAALPGGANCVGY